MQNKENKNKRKIIIFLSCFGTCVLAIAGVGSVLKPDLMRNIFPINVAQLATDPSEQGLDLVCDNVQSESNGFWSNIFEFKQCHVKDPELGELARTDTSAIERAQPDQDIQEQPSITKGQNKDSSGTTHSLQNKQFAQLSDPNNATGKQNKVGKVGTNSSSKIASQNIPIGVEYRSGGIQTTNNEVQTNTNENEHALETDSNETTDNVVSTSPTTEPTDNEPNVDVVSTTQPATETTNNEPTVDVASTTPPATETTDNEPTVDVVSTPPATKTTDNEPNVDVASTTPPATETTDNEPIVDVTSTTPPATETTDNEPTVDVVSSPPATETTNNEPTVDVVNSPPATDITDNEPVIEIASNQPTEGVSSTQGGGTLILQPKVELEDNEQQLDDGLVSNVPENNENIINNGIISSDNNDLFTVTGELSGSGIFTTDVKLLGAEVNPGNSPGLLTFGADLFIDSTNTDLTHLLIEITGTESRGVDYDAIDVGGNLQFLSELNISTSIFPTITKDELFGIEFDILHVDGNLLDASDNIVEFDDLSNLPINIEESWGFKWFERVSGWGLVIFTNQDPQNQSTNNVSEPKTVFIASILLIAFGIRRYRNTSSIKK